MDYRPGDRPKLLGSIFSCHLANPVPLPRAVRFNAVSVPFSALGSLDFGQSARSRLLGFLGYGQRAVQDLDGLAQMDLDQIPAIAGIC